MNKKVGNYALIREIGRGNYSRVFLAESSAAPGQRFAVKWIDKVKFAEKGKILGHLLCSELTIMSKVVHPNVMALLEFIETSGSYYLVLPFCDGGDLQSRLAELGRFGEREAVGFLRDLRAGFLELRKFDVIHRDLKLENLMLREGRVVIGDFGFGHIGSECSVTKLGTAATMAPEILFKAPGQSYDSRADLWSIGVCFYQMLFGRYPFLNHDGRGTAWAELADLVRFSSGASLHFPDDAPVSPLARDLLVRLIEFDPRRRMGWQEFFNHPIFGNGLVNTPVVGLRPFADLCLGKSAGEDSETVDLGSSGSEQRALPDFGAGTGSLGSLPSDSLNTDIELQFGLNTSARSFFKHEETAPPPAEKPATFGAALWVAKKFWFLARRTDPQLAEVSVRLKLTAFCLAKKVLAVWADPRQLETFALLRRSQSLGCSPLKPRTSLPQDSKLFDSAKDLFEAIRDDLTANVPAEALGSDGEDLLGRGQTGKDLELFLTKMYIYFNGLPTETFRRPLIRQMFRSALNQLRQCVYEKMQGAGTGEADRLAIPTFPDFDKADIYPQTPMVRGPGLEFFGELL